MIYAVCRPLKQQAVESQKLSSTRPVATVQRLVAFCNHAGCVCARQGKFPLSRVGEVWNTLLFLLCACAFHQHIYYSKANNDQH